eukprot:657347-Hanusia_phi.AAC.2
MIRSREELSKVPFVSSTATTSTQFSLYCTQGVTEPVTASLAAASFEPVVPSYADNIAIVARLSSVAQATGRLIQVLKEDLNLEIQPREFKFSRPLGVDDRLTQLEESCFKLGGTPVPTLQYFLLPSAVFPQTLVFQHPTAKLLIKLTYAVWGGCQFQRPAEGPGDPGNDLNGPLPYSEGGDGFTPQEGVASVYWSATAKFLQWASGISLFKDRTLAPSSPFIPSSDDFGELPSSPSRVR